MKKIVLGDEKGKLRAVAAEKEGKKITKLPQKKNSKHSSMSLICANRARKIKKTKWKCLVSIEKMES